MTGQQVALGLAVVALILALVGWLGRVRWVRSRVRVWWVYRRRWQTSMWLCGLAVRDLPEWEVVMVPAAGHRRTRLLYPRLGRGCRAGSFVDRLPVAFVPGQTVEQWRDAAPALASAFKVTTCRVQVADPGSAVLVFGHGDPLGDVLPALPVADEPDLAALPVGRSETGDPWTIALAGSHLLIAGATGAGKGSVLWGLIRALAPAVRDGWVQVWAVDPKGGMELAPGAGLFTRFAYADLEDQISLLEEAVCVMQARAVRLWGVTRQHTPSVGEPLIVVVVDELLTLTAYGVDTAAKKRVQAALGALLSKGRAIGVIVIGAVQDPRKESLPFRDLFPNRIALRLRERESTDLVLGDGARKAGAVCDDIPASTPGVGFVIGEHSPDPVRVRAGYVTDDDIAAMVQAYAPEPNLAVAS